MSTYVFIKWYVYMYINNVKKHKAKAVFVSSWPRTVCVNQWLNGTLIFQDIDFTLVLLN